MFIFSSSWGDIHLSPQSFREAKKKKKKRKGDFFLLFFFFSLFLWGNLIRGKFRRSQSALFRNDPRAGITEIRAIPAA